MIKIWGWSGCFHLFDDLWTKILIVQNYQAMLAGLDSAGQTLLKYCWHFPGESSSHGETETETETVSAKQTTLSPPPPSSSLTYLEWPCHRDGLYRDLWGSHPGAWSRNKGQHQITAWSHHIKWPHRQHSPSLARLKCEKLCEADPENCLYILTRILFGI